MCHCNNISHHLWGNKEDNKESSWVFFKVELLMFDFVNLFSLPGQCMANFRFIYIRHTKFRLVRWCMKGTSTYVVRLRSQRLQWGFVGYIPLLKLTWTVIYYCRRQSYFCYGTLYLLRNVMVDFIFHELPRAAKSGRENYIMKSSCLQRDSNLELELTTLRYRNHHRNR